MVVAAAGVDAVEDHDHVEDDTTDTTVGILLRQPLKLVT
jgi:hypothetical protein